MISLKKISVLALLLGLSSWARAEGSSDLVKLFPKDATVSTEGPGLSRLDLPPDVISQCRADLSDLRIIDLQGKEVPFLVVGAEWKGSKIVAEQNFSPSVRDAKREALFLGDAQRPPLHRESFEIDAPTTPPKEGTWQLVFNTQQPEFIRQVTVETIREDGLGTAFLTKGSIFRLPNIPAEKIRVPLPELVGSRLKVSMEGEGDFYIDPKIQFESSKTLATGQTLEVPLQEISRHEQKGKTILEISRPRGLMLDSLKLKTDTGTFHRHFSAYDAGPGSDHSNLGEATLFRLESLTPVEALELPLGSARGDRLRIEIDNGDSPPLEGARFSAVVVQPSLIFSLSPANPGKPSGKLYFGGGRAFQPHYDLAGMVLPGEVLGGENSSKVMERLYDVSQMGKVHLGPIESNPDFNASPALSFAMRAGAPIDSRLYTHRREVTVVPSTEGLTSLQLQVEDLAIAREDLADIRIIDGKNQQWPYLLEKSEEGKRIDLEIKAPVTKNGESVYEIALPANRLQMGEILLETKRPFFNRSFRVVADAGKASERVLAEGNLKRNMGDTEPIKIDLGPTSIGSLQIAIQDGNDIPLELSGAWTHVALPTLFVAAPEGSYALLLGNAQDQIPRYDLEAARDTVLSVQSAAANVGKLEPNPEYKKGAEVKPVDRKGQLILWSVLGVAVLALGTMSLKMARN